MKKDKAEPRVPNTGIYRNNENTGNAQQTIDTSILKKNEFILILLGALLLTIIIFFLFFRSPDPKPGSSKSAGNTTSLAEIEERLGKIELAYQSQIENLKSLLESKNNGAQNSAVKGETQLEKRVARVEAALSLKFDSVTKRIGELEQNIAKITPEKAMQPINKSIPETTKTKTVPDKKDVKKPIVKKTVLFHTVTKGETLYGISRKYKISVDKLRELNNFSTDTKIYPGDNILVR